MLAPAFLPGLLFYGVPILLTAAMSATSWNMLSPARFVGFGNYLYLLRSDPDFLRTMLNTVVFAAGSTLVGVPLALVVAWAIGASRGQGAWRVAFWLPMVTNVVAIGYAWRFLLDPTYGLLNRLLDLLGLGGPDWLNQPETAMATVILVSVWAGLGHNILLFAAALAGIDATLYDAARLDGAREWQILRRMTLPLLRPAVLFASVTGMIAGLGSFALILVLTDGGPEGSTDVTALYLYRMAFEHLRMGRASAAAFILFGLILLLTVAQVVWLRRGGFEAE